MPTSSSILYTPRIELPTMVQRAATATVSLDVYRGGTQQIPTSGTITITRPDGTDYAAAQAVTIAVSGTASYAVGDTTAEALSDGWTIAWALVMPDTLTHTFRSDGALVRNLPTPVVTSVDLYRRVTSLDPAGTAPLSVTTDYSPALDEAWIEISQRLIRAGRRPWLIISSSALRQVHMALALKYIIQDMAMRGNPVLSEMTLSQQVEYERQWSDLNLVYDRDDSGTPDDANARLGATSATLWTCGRGWAQ